jgi:hypothetical protein
VRRVLKGYDTKTRVEASGNLASWCNTHSTSSGILRNLQIARRLQHMSLVRWLATALALPAAVLACWPDRADTSLRAFGTSVAAKGHQDGSLGCSRPLLTAFDSTRVARDLQGNQYITDRRAHVIRRLAPDGTVTIFAGHLGLKGHADGVGESATFHHPVGIAFDGVDSLYVADSGNHTIRRANVENGTVTTVAGVAGRPGFDVGAEAARPARLNKPTALAFYNEQLLIVDSGNHAVRRLAEPQVVLPFAGVVGLPGDAETRAERFISHFRTPSAIKVLTTGSAASPTLLVLDQGNCAVRQILETHVVTLGRCGEPCFQ